MEKRNYQFKLVIMTGDAHNTVVYIPIDVALTPDEVQAFIPHLLDVWNFYRERDLGWCLADWPDSVADICAIICERAEQLAEMWHKKNNMTFGVPCMIDFPDEMYEMAAPYISWHIDLEEHDKAARQFWEKYAEKEAALLREGKMKYLSNSMPPEMRQCFRNKYRSE